MTFSDGSLVEHKFKLLTKCLSWQMGLFSCDALYYFSFTSRTMVTELPLQIPEEEYIKSGSSDKAANLASAQPFSMIDWFIKFCSSPTDKEENVASTHLSSPSDMAAGHIKEQGKKHLNESTASKLLRWRSTKGKDTGSLDNDSLNYCPLESTIWEKRALERKRYLEAATRAENRRIQTSDTCLMSVIPPPPPPSYHLSKPKESHTVSSDSEAGAWPNLSQRSQNYKSLIASPPRASPLLPDSKALFYLSQQTILEGSSRESHPPYGQKDYFGRYNDPRWALIDDPELKQRYKDYYAEYRAQKDAEENVINAIKQEELSEKRENALALKKVEKEERNRLKKLKRSKKVEIGETVSKSGHDDGEAKQLRDSSSPPDTNDVEIPSSSGVSSSVPTVSASVQSQAPNTSNGPYFPQIILSSVNWTIKMFTSSKSSLPKSPKALMKVTMPDHVILPPVSIELKEEKQSKQARHRDVMTALTQILKNQKNYFDRSADGTFHSASSTPYSSSPGYISRGSLSMGGYYDSDSPYKKVANGDGRTFRNNRVGYKVILTSSFDTSESVVWTPDVHCPLFIYPNIREMCDELYWRCAISILPYLAHVIDDQWTKPAGIEGENLYRVPRDGFTMSDLLTWRYYPSSRFGNKKNGMFAKALELYTKEEIVKKHSGRSVYNQEQWYYPKRDDFISNTMERFSKVVALAYVQIFYENFGYGIISKQGTAEIHDMAFDYFMATPVPELGYIFLDFIDFKNPEERKAVPTWLKKSTAKIPADHTLDSVDFLNNLLQKTQDNIQRYDCITAMYAVCVLKSPYFFKYVLRSLLFFVHSVQVDDYMHLRLSLHNPKLDSLDSGKSADVGKRHEEKQFTHKPHPWQSYLSVSTHKSFRAVMKLLTISNHRRRSTFIEDLH